MWRLLWFATAVPALAQFSGLSATDDGKHLYFGTRSRLVGSADVIAHDKVYRLAESGFEVFAAVPQLMFITQDGLAPTSNPYAFGSPQVSGDGQTVATRARASCSGTPNSCRQILTTYCYVRRADVPGSLELKGTCQISHNGRFVLNGQALSSVQPMVPFVRTDLRSGEQVEIRDGFPASRALAPNGDVLLVSPATGRLGMWNGSTVRELSTTREITAPSQAWLSADGSTVVYEAAGPEAWELRRYSIRTGVDLLLAHAPLTAVGRTYRASMTNDGSKVVFLAPPDSPAPSLYLFDGVQNRWLFGQDAGVADSVIAGSGVMAYAATKDGTLVRVTVSDGRAELLARSPQIEGASLGGAPGSLLTLYTEFPLKEADGWRVRIGDIEAPVWMLHPDWLHVQIPWEAPVGSTAAWLSRAGWMFEAPLEMTLQSRVVRPLTGDRLIHGDFSGYVSEEAPTRPGGVVVFYATGLGAVTPPLPTGEAAPVSPLSIAAPLACVVRWRDTVLDAETLYAGLAPGLLGVYQVNLRLPEVLQSGEWLVDCGPESAFRLFVQ